jgi:tungstate transport system substrate-binding protein
METSLPPVFGKEIDMHHLKEAPLWRRAVLLAFAVMLVFGLVGCGTDTTETAQVTEAPVEATEVILSSTTSTEDSGLFDELIPAFEEAHPEYAVKVIAVGTGEALELGRNKDADVMLVHATADEEAMVTEGYAVNRSDVMYNDFIIVGPTADPAGVKGAADITAAMAAIQKAGEAGEAKFISRGDDSGTHKKELKLWPAAGIDPAPTPETADWYEESGQGMGDTLNIASEEAAYTMADRATYLAMKDALELEILFEKDPALLNQYGVLVVTDAKKQEGGQAFYDWIIADEAQELIGQFGVEKYGEPLFIPNAP